MEPCREMVYGETTNTRSMWGVGKITRLTVMEFMPLRKATIKVFYFSLRIICKFREARLRNRKLSQRRRIQGTLYSWKTPW